MAKWFIYYAPLIGAGLFAIAGVVMYFVFTSDLREPQGGNTKRKASVGAVVLGIIWLAGIALMVHKFFSQ